MSRILSKEVHPAEYTYAPESYEEPMRDQVIADLAGITVGQMVRLEGQHYSGLQTETFTLPTRIGGEEVVALRSGNELGLDGITTAPRGGTRLYQQGSKEEVTTLADGMDTKYALNLNHLVKLGIVDPESEIPVGGKSEIILPVDPRTLSSIEKATVIQEFTEAMIDRGFFFERNHRTGPDMNMGPEDMALMRDILMANGYSAERANSLVTGKPVGDGGVMGRAEATARGGAVVFDQYLKRLEVPEDTEATFSIQGYGNAGAPLENQFNQVSDYKGILVCVSDEFGTIYNPNGINPEHFRNLLFERDKHDNRHYLGVYKAGFDYREKHDPETIVRSRDENPDMWLEVNADCYVPAAIGKAINITNVHKLQSGAEKGSTRFVLPLANYGISPQAQIELEKRGVRTVNHAHANGYGVTASLVESAFANGRFSKDAVKTPEAVYEVIDTIARATTNELFELSNSGSITPTASLAAAADARRVQVLYERLG